ncbi:hypothetical protein BYT27DRAFT_7078304 [Phlegmacium glaucopus]|nr:hypothetical protein BYT27DRAFT_7078304 [Phlegmacium glaucopus]
MNYLDKYSSNLPRQNPRSRRPATISELADRANVVWDESRGFRYYIRLAEKYRNEGKDHARAGDMENAFVEFARAATLVIERLPEHPDYRARLTDDQRHNLGLHSSDILDALAELRLGLVDRYEKWCQEHPNFNGIEENDTTPNAHYQRIANENAARRARLKRELQPGAEEAARAIRQGFSHADGCSGGHLPDYGGHAERVRQPQMEEREEMERLQRALEGCFKRDMEDEGKNR